MTTLRPRGTIRYDNSGRVVIVTGGAGGIGSAICEAFGDSMASVVAADVDFSGSELTEAVVRCHCDTSQEADREEVVERTLQHFGAVDVLVNCAAIQPPESYRPLDEIGTDVWSRMVGINLSGYHFMAKHAVPRMLEQGSGVIVNIASGQAHHTAREVVSTDQSRPPT